MRGTGTRGLRARRFGGGEVAANRSSLAVWIRAEVDHHEVWQVATSTVVNGVGGIGGFHVKRRPASRGGRREVVAVTCRVLFGFM